MPSVARRGRLAAALGVAVGGAVLAFGVGAPAPAAPPSRGESGVPAALRALDAPTSELAVSRTEGARGATILRARQQLGGVPVLGAESVIVRSADGSVAEIADDTVEGLEPPGPADLERDTAIAVARGLFTPSQRGRVLEASSVVEPRSGELAWRVVIALARPPSEREILVSAVDGEVLERSDLTRRATGRGSVYAPNPIAEQGSYTGLRDRDDRDSPRLTRLRREVELPRMSGERGCLRGTAAIVRAGRRKRSVCRADRDWRDATRADRAFEAVLAYWQIDRTRSYLDGLGLSRRIFDAPQTVFTNARRIDNSFFMPASGRIILGSGGVDDGEDADIVAHEYGHAVQEAQVPGFGRSFQGAAMGEAFGDYLAAAMSAESRGSRPRFAACIAEWDSTSYTPRPSCLRRADSPRGLDRAADDCAGLRVKFYCVGLTWSAALWDLRGELGDDVLGRSIGDRLVLESQFMLTPKATFRSAARALLAADDSLYGGVHRDAILAEMARRDICRPTGCGG